MNSRYFGCFTLILIFVFFVMGISLDTASARPPRRPLHRRPAVVKPRVTVAPIAKSKAVVVSESAAGYTESEKVLTPQEIKNRRINAEEYGLIDLEVYPYSTKIYVDGRYKGYARTLNKDKNSLKVRKGKHLIELKDAGRPTKVINVTVKAGYKLIISFG